MKESFIYDHGVNTVCQIDPSTT